MKLTVGHPELGEEIVLETKEDLTDFLYNNIDNLIEVASEYEEMDSNDLAQVMWEITEELWSEAEDQGYANTSGWEFVASDRRVDKPNKYEQVVQALNDFHTENEDDLYDWEILDMSNLFHGYAQGLTLNNIMLIHVAQVHYWADINEGMTFEKYTKPTIEHYLDITDNVLSSAKEFEHLVPFITLQLNLILEYIKEDN